MNSFVNQNQNQYQMGGMNFNPYQQQWQPSRQPVYKADPLQGEVAAALYIDCLICDVDEELVWAQKKQMKLETLGYDIGAIIQCSEALHKKYK